MTSPLPDCFVLPYSDADGPLNMAKTGAPGMGGTRPVGGLFSDLRMDRADPNARLFPEPVRGTVRPAWRDVALVRRPTGGGAIWHDREITYALAVPSGHPLSRQSKTLYHEVHGAIASLLEEWGWRRNAEGRAVPPTRTPLDLSSVSPTVTPRTWC